MAALKYIVVVNEMYVVLRVHSCNFAALSLNSKPLRTESYSDMP